MSVRPRQPDIGHPRWRASVRGGIETAMRPTELRLWAAWLRLNPQCQIRGTFRQRQPDGTLRVCVIGALEQIADADVTFLFSPLNEGKFMRQVVLMNDVFGWTFPQIADWLDLIADGALSLREALEIRDYADLPLGGLSGALRTALRADTRFRTPPRIHSRRLTGRSPARGFL